MNTVSLVLLSFVTMLSGSSSAGLARPALAEITGVNRDGSDIIFFVVSNGCTDKSDFKLAVTELTQAEHMPSTAKIELFRLHPDRCKRMPFVMPLVLSEAMHAVQASQIILVNPLIAFEGAKRRIQQSTGSK